MQAAEMLADMNSYIMNVSQPSADTVFRARV